MGEASVMRQLGMLDADFLHKEAAHFDSNITLIKIYDQSTAPAGKVRFSFEEPAGPRRKPTRSISDFSQQVAADTARRRSPLVGDLCHGGAGWFSRSAGRQFRPSRQGPLRRGRCRSRRRHLHAVARHDAALSGLWTAHALVSALPARQSRLVGAQRVHVDRISLSDGAEAFSLRDATRPGGPQSPLHAQENAIRAAIAARLKNAMSRRLFRAPRHNASARLALAGSRMMSMPVGSTISPCSNLF